MSKQVYLPVCVDLESGEATVDYDGMPWSWVPEVWDTVSEEWVRDDEALDDGITGLYRALRGEGRTDLGEHYREYVEVVAPLRVAADNGEGSYDAFDEAYTIWLEDLHDLVYNSGGAVRVPAPGPDYGRVAIVFTDPIFAKRLVELSHTVTVLETEHGVQVRELTDGRIVRTLYPWAQVESVTWNMPRVAG